MTTNTYEIRFYTCPAHKPFHFAVHPWIVIIKNGIATRWEVLYMKNKGIKNVVSYVYKNLYTETTRGITTTKTGIEHWPSKQIGHIQGGETSLAHRMYDFIDTMAPHYPYADRYHLFPGPNSNSFIAWILREFPEADIKLPWNAFGKHYR